MWCSTVSNDFTDNIYQLFSGSFYCQIDVGLTIEFQVKKFANQLLLEASTGIDAFQEGIVWFIYKDYFSASRKRKERISNRVCARRPCWRSKTIKLFSFGKKFNSHANIFLLFTPPTWPPHTDSILFFDIIAFGIIKKSVTRAPFVICDLPLVEY